MKKKIELLAPCGSLEILKAAVDCGADAVYCGLPRYNARINADNFSIEELIEGINYAHLRSSKVFLTANTIMTEDEFDEFFPDITEVVEAGLDGLIVADIGALRKLSSAFPDVMITASTQMNVFADDEFKELSLLGAGRVVLPRELSVDEIAKRVRIASRYGLECEVFAHGAVCVCVSGVCLFSAMNKGGTRSGNRGTCAQPCREDYILSNDGLVLRDGHLLSPKDRDVTDHLRSLINAGVASLKVEGRMRDASYVRSAVTCYRRLIDGILDDSLTKEEIKDIKSSLLVNFNRGGSYTSQYLSGVKDDKFLSGEYPGKFGLKLGKISRLDKSKGTVTFSRAASSVLPDKGDYLSIRDDRKEICSFPLGKIHETPDSLSVKGLHPDQIAKLKPGQTVYLMSHKTQLGKEDLRRTPVNFSLSIKDGFITLNAMVTSGINYGIFAESRDVLPDGYEGQLSAERIIEQLNKTLNTPFIVKEVFIDDSLYSCPVSLINGIRRKALEELELAIIGKHYKKTQDIETENTASFEQFETSSLTMFTYPCLKANGSGIRAGADIYNFSIYDMADPKLRDMAIKAAKENEARLSVFMPDFYHDRSAKIFDKILTKIREEAGDIFYAVIDSRLLSGNKHLEEYGVMHFISGACNIYNPDSLKTALDLTDGLYLSHELSPDEAISLLGTCARPDKTVIINRGGEIAWMQSDFCPAGQNQKNCVFCKGKPVFELEQKRERGIRLHVLPHPLDCSSAVYGPAKNVFSETQAEALEYMNINKIYNYTVLTENDND